jgi:hypothetical protein
MIVTDGLNPLKRKKKRKTVPYGTAQAWTHVVKAPAPDPYVSPSLADASTFFSARPMRRKMSGNSRLIDSNFTRRPSCGGTAQVGGRREGGD